MNMKDKLIEIYLSKKNEAVDFSIINNVTIDNVIAKMNEIYNYDWTYEIVETKEFYGELFVNIALYIPGRVFTCITVINLKDFNPTSCIETALYKAFKNMYSLPEYDLTTMEINDTSNITNVNANNNIISDDNKTNPSAKSLTLEELDELEEEERKVKTSYNNIREDQIEYMNNFKEKYNIDSDTKFNYYIRTWSDNTENNIETKIELVSAGEKAIDSFINWVELITKNNGLEEPKVLSPI